MKRLITAWIIVSFSGVIFAAIAPQQNLEYDVELQMSGKALKFMQSSSQKLKIKYLQGTNAMDLTGGTNVLFAYAPASRSWLVTVTGSLHNASNGEAIVTFAPAQLNTNSVNTEMSWRMSVANATDTLAYAYGDLTIVEDIFSTASGTLPASTNLDWSDYTLYQNTALYGPCRAGDNVTLSTNSDGSVNVNAEAGDITDVSPGTGMAGGGSSGNVTMSLDAASVASLLLADSATQPSDNWTNTVAGMSAVDVTNGATLGATAVQAESDPVFTAVSNTYYLASNPSSYITDADVPSNATVGTNTLKNSYTDATIVATALQPVSTNGLIRADGSVAFTGNQDFASNQLQNTVLSSPLLMTPNFNSGFGINIANGVAGSDVAAYGQIVSATNDLMNKDGTVKGTGDFGFGGFNLTNMLYIQFSNGLIISNAVRNGTNSIAFNYQGTNSYLLLP